MSKCEVISGPYFPVCGLNAGKHGPETTLYLDTFHAVDKNGEEEGWKILNYEDFNHNLLVINFLFVLREKYN